MIFADKICTDEETVRLRSHDRGDPQELTAGEALDVSWISLRMGDEPQANTILSKANDLEVSDCALHSRRDRESQRADSEY
ncbi:MAG: endoribonuclease YicC domain-containing protein [Clostridium fessum]